ncbi:WD40 repeat domain-containing protein [Dactylosporangium aurantiacum]|uniref:WD40 repeat domain-containing protein n=1 Tax=Dactylosporangium aurantiacum TaxID=35754 RepID=UPI000523FDFF|nr:hypothetical protein [Dactylosporangium aurantiacum]MDG6106433.1 hypothetical protein [Dactylosporangium aurantiacum]
MREAAAPAVSPGFRQAAVTDDNDSYVTGVSFTPDGSRYVTGSLDGRVLLHQQGRAGAELLHQTGNAVALSPNGQVVAFAVDGGVTVKDVASKAQLGRIKGVRGPQRLDLVQPRRHDARRRPRRWRGGPVRPDRQGVRHDHVPRQQAAAVGRQDVRAAGDRL